MNEYSDNVWIQINSISGNINYIDFNNNIQCISDLKNYLFESIFINLTFINNINNHILIDSFLFNPTIKYNLSIIKSNSLYYYFDKIFQQIKDKILSISNHEIYYCYKITYDTEILTIHMRTQLIYNIRYYRHFYYNKHYKTIEFEKYIGEYTIIPYLENFSNILSYMYNELDDLIIESYKYSDNNRLCIEYDLTTDSIIKESITFTAL